MTPGAHRILTSLGLAAILGGNTGCFGSTVARLRTDDAPGVAAANVAPESIVVFPFTNVGRPYDIIGVVVAASSLGDSSGDRTFVANKMLQKEAAALGADAIVGASMEREMGFWGACGQGQRDCRETPVNRHARSVRSG